MLKDTPPLGAGWLRLTMKLKIVVPALPSFKLTSLIDSEGPTTVRVDWALFTVVVPSAEARMCAAPGLCPLTFAEVTTVIGFVETESIVAAVVLSEVKVIGAPFMARPYSSRA